MDVDSIHVSGTWWRHTPAGGDVFYAPDDPGEGRWQRGEVVDAWYFADEPDTAWAEWYRAVAELGVPPMQQLPHAEGFQGLLAPSAARPDHTILCMFRTAREMPGAQPVPPPETIDEPPNVPQGLST